MAMNMKFWRNPDVSGAKKLEKQLKALPEYKAFVEKRAFYDELLGNGKYVGVHVDSFERFKGKGAVYDKVRQELAENLDKWKVASDSIFQEQIEKAKFELEDDAHSLLAKSRLYSEKSGQIALLEKGNASATKIGKRLAVAGGIGVLATFAAGVIEAVGVHIGWPAGAILMEVVGIAGIVAGLMQIGRFKDALGVFKDAIGIARGDEETKEYVNSSWQFWIHG